MWLTALATSRPAGSIWTFSSVCRSERLTHRWNRRRRRRSSALTRGFQGSLQVRDPEIDIDPTRAPSRASVGVPNVDAGLAQLLGNPTQAARGVRKRDLQDLLFRCFPAARRRDLLRHRRLVDDHSDCAAITFDPGRERQDVGFLGPQRGAYLSQHPGPVRDPNRKLLRPWHVSTSPRLEPTGRRLVDQTDRLLDPVLPRYDDLPQRREPA